ncbi:MAG: hypothetical protein AB1665_06380 [Candidatus Thermoplasmatota archaeon]
MDAERGAPKGWICDINVVYPPKSERYTTTLSHMNELYAIAEERLQEQKRVNTRNIM